LSIWIAIIFFPSEQRRGGRNEPGAGGREQGIKFETSGENFSLLHAPVLPWLTERYLLQINADFLFCAAGWERRLKSVTGETPKGMAECGRAVLDS